MIDDIPTIQKSPYTWFKRRFLFKSNMFFRSKREISESICVSREKNQMHEPHAAGHYNVPLQATPPCGTLFGYQVGIAGVVVGVLLRRVPQDVRIFFKQKPTNWCHLSREKKNSYFPWNTGCLIGILKMVYYNPYMTG